MTCDGVLLLLQSTALVQSSVKENRQVIDSKVQSSRKRYLLTNLLSNKMLSFKELSFPCKLSSSIFPCVYFKVCLLISQGAYLEIPFFKTKKRKNPKTAT